MSKRVVRANGEPHGPQYLRASRQQFDAADQLWLRSLEGGSQQGDV
jgi:hypothetical protein